MDDFLNDDLNTEQNEAVTSTEGYIRVVAGAGSGKTRALTQRFAYLVNELGIRPGNILCVTFTNKAASEMRTRIHALTGDNDTGFIGTFHSFCVSVLQEESFAVGFPKSFLVLDNADIDDMLKVIYEERSLTLRDKTYKDARDMFEMRKCVYERNYYEKLIALPLDTLHETYMKAVSVDDILFYGYLYQQKKCFGLDYNDLIILTIAIFRSRDEIRLKWEKRLEYIMVDEFQDIDPLQYELMTLLCAYHNNLFIVGDPDQTIYTWRGARIGYIIEFEKNFPDVKTIMMNQNYRSTPEILNAANSLISTNRNRIEKNLLTDRKHGPLVRYHHGTTAENEAQFIASEIKRLHAQGIAYRDIAILYRAHYVTRSIEDVFLKQEIPYTIYSGTPFFGRMEIKDALSYLRMIALKDDLSFRRICNVPKRNLGKRRMQFLEEYATENDCTLYEALNRNMDDPLFSGTKAKQFIALVEKFNRSYQDRAVSEVLADLLDQSGYEKMLRTEGSQSRLDDLAELKQSIYEYEATCGEETDVVTYLNHISTFTNLDGMSLESDRVKMMTVHAAKGLEFPCVFMASMCEGIFPSRKIATEPAMEEERRLAFVAVTRAEKMLYLSDHEGRNFDDSSRYPSRFIFNIDRKYLQYDEELPDDLVKAAKRYIASNEKRLLPSDEDMPVKEGDRVAHPVFGEGKIIRIDRDQSVIEIQFDKMKTTRELTMKALNKLVKL